MDVLIFVISLAASFVFALGGIGGAIVLIPLLISLGIPVDIARPVGLFNNIISMTGATVSNIKHKRLDVKAGIPIIVTSFLFAIAGAWGSKFISEKVILIIFIFFLLFSGFMFLFHQNKGKGNYRTDVPYMLLSVIGAVAGLMSGILGIGGGGIISPLMLMAGFDPKKNAVITAFVVPFSSLSGFLTYWAMGHVDWKLLIIVSVGGYIGALLGTSFMHRKLDSQAVKKILAVILLLMAVKLFFHVL